MKPRSGVSVDLNVLLDFFLAFSRFEYALKVADYARPFGPVAPGFPAAVAPDWAKFGRDIASAFRRGASDALREACDRLDAQPPMREVVLDGEHIGWDSCLREKEPESEVERLLLFVRTVRNNLFHGGKFGVWANEEIERNTSLLLDSMVFFDSCLQLAPRVREAFEDAAL